MTDEELGGGFTMEQVGLAKEKLYRHAVNFPAPQRATRTESGALHAYIQRLEDEAWKYRDLCK